MEPHRRRIQEEEYDEDGWPLPPSAHSTPTRKQKYVDEWLSTQSASNLSIPYKNRSRNFSQSTRGSSCKSFRSNSSSRKLHRGLLKSALKKKQSSIYKQATSYLPSSRARASTSSASNQSFVIDSKYKSPTRKSAADRSRAYEKTVNFKSPSSAKSPRGSTGKCPCSLIRGGATPTGKDGSSSAGQDLMNQFVGNLLAPGGPLNVNSEIIKELAYALVKYYDEQDVIAAERAYGSPKELPKFDVSTDDVFDEEPASNQQRSRAFGTRLQPGPSTRAAETIQPAGQSINYGSPRPRTVGSLLGKSPRPQSVNLSPRQ